VLVNVVVCGGQEYRPEGDAFSNLRGVLTMCRATSVYHGGARGADTFAGIVATSMGLTVHVIGVTQEEWDKYRGSAGPRRNTRLASYAEALIALPGDNGTRDMVTKAKAKRIRVVILRANGTIDSDESDLQMGLFGCSK
jgi:predicted Rossmann-fold nucleotide-binding protein